MTNASVFIGEPLNFKNKIWIYPPKVKDVITNPKFGFYVKILTLTAEDIQDRLQEEGVDVRECPTPFEFLLANCYHSKEFRDLTVETFQYFCHIDIAFSYEDKKIICGQSDQTIYLTEEDFFDFQNAIRESIGNKKVESPEPINPNEDPRITEIKRRARERDRIKARRSSKDGISLETCLVAICCMGIGITPLNIGEMSYAAIGEIMKMMQNKEKYDIDIRSLLAGADSKKIKPKYWIRNSDKE